jgi:hypothetical protein
MNNLIRFVFIFLSVSKALFAQDYAQATLEYNDKIYRNNIHSVILKPSTLNFGFPMIMLGKQQLKLEFDDLDNDIKTLFYTVVHCNFDWTPSNIAINEYLPLQQIEQISASSNSFNTHPPYTNYQHVFPNSNMPITKSGNYLLKVFEDDNQDNLLLTRRFVVFEQQALVTGTVQGATEIENRNYKQELDFVVVLPENINCNPYEDVMVSIVPNSDFSRANTTLKPRFVNNNKLDYNFDKENVFDGGNEFRNFDLFNIRGAVTNMFINKIEVSENNHYDVFLTTDETKNFKKYTLTNDINGYFKINSSFGSNPSVDAEYVNVHFNLKVDAQYENSDVYVYGAFSNFQCLTQYKCTFNSQYNRYLANALLKQGFYDYKFVVKNNNSSQGIETIIEGNRFETENDYYLFVYQKGIGFYYDKCIGAKVFKANALNIR